MKSKDIITNIMDAKALLVSDQVVDKLIEHNAFRTREDSDSVFSDPFDYSLLGARRAMDLYILHRYFKLKNLTPTMEARLARLLKTNAYLSKYLVVITDPSVRQAIEKMSDSELRSFVVKIAKYVRRTNKTVTAAQVFRTIKSVKGEKAFLRMFMSELGKPTVIKRAIKRVLDDPKNLLKPTKLGKLLTFILGSMAANETRSLGDTDTGVAEIFKALEDINNPQFKSMVRTGKYKATFAAISNMCMAHRNLDTILGHMHTKLSDNERLMLMSAWRELTDSGLKSVDELTSFLTESSTSVPFVKALKGLTLITKVTDGLESYPALAAIRFSSFAVDGKQLGSAQYKDDKTKLIKSTLMVLNLADETGDVEVSKTPGFRDRLAFAAGDLQVIRTLFAGYIAPGDVFKEIENRLELVNAFVRTAVAGLFISSLTLASRASASTFTLLSAVMLEIAGTIVPEVQDELVDAILDFHTLDHISL